MMYHTMRFASMTLLAMMTMSGCAEMNSKFDCPMKQGVRCESIDQVNARIDQGEFSKAPITQEVPAKDSMRIWIAPYLDQEGNYHEGQYVHTANHDVAWKDNNNV